MLGERVVVFHRVGDVERVESLDAATGRSVWKADFRATYPPGVDPDTGPRCVPLIHDGAVYVYGAAGDLHGVRLADGKKLWSRPMLRDFNGDEGYFGAGSSPIVVGGRLLVNVGGRDGAGLVALGLGDGATLWQATDERASYSAPTAVVLDGQPYAVFVTRLNVVCVDPRDGTVRFRFPFGQRGATVNAATPLVCDLGLFVTANYGVGARLAKISRNGFELVWENDESLSSQYPTPVVRDGFLYGVHGREDVGVGQLRCVEAATGKVRWSVPDFGMAHLILADERLLILTVQGRLLLAAASPDRLETLATATVSTSVTRAAGVGPRTAVRSRNDGARRQPPLFRLAALTRQNVGWVKRTNRQRPDVERGIMCLPGKRCNSRAAHRDGVSILPDVASHIHGH